MGMDVPEPALLEAINAAESGRGHPVSCLLFPGRAVGWDPVPRGAQSRSRTGPDLARSRRCHRARLCLAGSAGYRKSPVPEVLPNGSSALNHFRPGRGAAAQGQSGENRAGIPRLGAA